MMISTETLEKLRNDALVQRAELAGRVQQATGAISILDALIAMSKAQQPEAEEEIEDDPADIVDIRDAAE